VILTKWSATPAVAVSVKVREVGEPAAPLIEAVIVLDPAVVPRVKLVVEYPLESELTLENPTDPPPEAIAKFTVVPLTGLPLLSTTCTLGAVETAEPIVADCESPATLIK
jgi:hypothetical protein